MWASVACPNTGYVRGLALHDCENVFLADDEVLFTVEFDLAAGVLRIDDLVADADFNLDEVAFVGLAAGSDRDDDAFLRLFFCGVREDDAAGRFRSLLDSLDDHTIAKRFEFNFGRGFGHG